MQINLGGTTAHQTGQDLAATLVPARQFLRSNRVGILSGVEATDQGRRAGGAAADIEGPADQGAVLVRIQDDGRGGLHGDAVLEGLRRDVVGQGRTCEKKKKNRQKQETEEIGGRSR